MVDMKMSKIRSSKELFMSTKSKKIPYPSPVGRACRAISWERERKQMTFHKSIFAKGLNLQSSETKVREKWCLETRYCLAMKTLR